jgi:hypothetical protein
MSHPFVTLFGGSRSLPPSQAGFVRSVVLAALARAGSFATVGCAAGADAAVVSAVLAAGLSGQLCVFCVGSASGAGFWSGSAPFSLLRRAAGSLARVVWSAGGGPELPFRARLLRRSLAALGAASEAVFFLASPSSPGSLAVAAAAVRQGVSVFAFSCGFSGSPVPLVGVGAGAWVRGVFCGFPCWVWSQPARPVQLSLF